MPLVPFLLAYVHHRNIMNPIMENLNSLPLEVISMILDCFEDDSMLLSVSLVSKRLCAIAQPRLFREITLSSSKILPLLLLLRTVVSSADLAAHVLSLEIEDAADSDEESQPDSLANFPQARTQHIVPVVFLGAEVAGMSEEVRNLNVPWQDAAPSILETTNACILSILLISFTPNIHHLSIAVDQRHLDLLLNLAKRLSDGVSRPLGLKSLRSLHLECLSDGHSSKVTIRDVASLLSLLHLTEFQLSGCAGYSWEEAAQLRPLGMLDKPLSLSTLAVIQSDLDAASMEMLCRSCKRLTVFHYEEADMGNEQLSHRQLHTSLHSQRLNLVNLRVGLSRNDNSSAIFTTDAQNSFFIEYVNAKFMGLDQLFLGILPQLPYSLEHLAIQYCRVPVLQTLTFVASQAKQGLLPAMNLISLHSDICYPGGMLGLPARGATDVLFEIACQDLQKLFRGTAIILRVESNLLEKTVQGYDFEYNHGTPGAFWPFIHLR
jgi:hypothetical protein